MKKGKRKSFWGENVSDRSQMNGMDDLLRLTRAVETGSTLPEVNFGDEEESSEFDTEVEMGVGDAISRLMSKNNSGAMPDGFNPLTRVEPAKEIPTVDYIGGGAGQEVSMGIRDMEIVEPDPEPAVPAPKMMAPSTVTAEDVIEDGDYSEDSEDDFAYDDRPLEFWDFAILYAEDDWLYVTNAYNPDLRFSISTFNLRGYNVEKNDMYQMMVQYAPLLFAILAGPALIVEQDDSTFRKFMRSSIDRNINVDKTKFMIFSVENKENKMFLIYVLDVASRNCILNDLMPQLVDCCEETDFFTQLSGLILHPMANPYGMIETMWPGDRASEELSTPEKVTEFCNLMMNELGIEPVESSKTSYNAAEANFKKKSVIGDIQKFLVTVKMAKESLEKQMNPDNYEEKFLEERDPEEAEEEAAADAGETEASGTDELFDGVGQDVEEPKQEEPPKTEPEPVKKTEEKSAKPAKVGADGKKSGTKKYEIPVQH